MNTDDSILAATLAIVQNIAGANRTPADLGPETRLGDDFWLDSVELLEVVVACEQEFEIAFDDTRDLESGALETLGTLVALIRAKQSALPRNP
jgi:acyl carrier protein